MTPLPIQEDGLQYMSGFGNTFECEVLPGALPKGRNNPRLVPYGLYTEQISGTAFTAPRSVNRRTWMYRIQPSVTTAINPMKRCTSFDYGGLTNRDGSLKVDPNATRWKPMPLAEDGVDFVAGVRTMMQSGSPSQKNGLSISMYSFTVNMEDSHFSNSDGDLLIVPQQGSLLVATELGKLIVHPREIVVVPRGIVFSIHKYGDDLDLPRRGYMLEIYKGHFTLPELGPIGSNGLANARDFLHPTAWCVTKSVYEKECIIWNKFGGTLFERTSPHSPYNVVAWHGNYVPFKYALDKFCVVNSVSFDHLDPCIYTVLTCVDQNEPGTALADFVIFPPRFLATDTNTFRPPWFHRNTMSEFMGLIDGGYDAKKGFEPGGASLHSIMTPHGPDAPSYEEAVRDECKTPVRFQGGMAFMFETNHLLSITEYGRNCSHRDWHYQLCWSGLTDSFSGWEALEAKNT